MYSAPNDVRKKRLPAEERQKGGERGEGFISRPLSNLEIKVGQRVIKPKSRATKKPVRMLRARLLPLFGKSYTFVIYPLNHTNAYLLRIFKSYIAMQPLNTNVNQAVKSCSGALVPYSRPGLWQTVDRPPSSFSREITVFQKRREREREREREKQRGKGIRLHMSNPGTYALTWELLTYPVPSI